MKKKTTSVLIVGLVAAMEKARSDRYNATWGHICQVCGPDVWHKDGSVCLGLCGKHWQEVKQKIR